MQRLLLFISTNPCLCWSTQKHTNTLHSWPLPSSSQSEEARNTCGQGSKRTQQRTRRSQRGGAAMVFYLITYPNLAPSMLAFVASRKRGRKTAFRGRSTRKSGFAGLVGGFRVGCRRDGRRPSSRPSAAPAQPRRPKNRRFLLFPRKSYPRTRPAALAALGAVAGGAGGVGRRCLNVGSGGACFFSSAHFSSGGRVVSNAFFVTFSFKKALLFFRFFDTINAAKTLPSAAAPQIKSGFARLVGGFRVGRRRGGRRTPSRRSAAPAQPG